jgi:hypothetical protein
MTQMVRKHIIVPADVAAAFSKLVGERNVSAEIAALMEQRLQRERLKGAFDALAAAPKGDHPEWETAEDIARWVREQRAEWDRPITPHS